MDNLNNNQQPVTERAVSNQDQEGCSRAHPHHAFQLLKDHQTMLRTVSQTIEKVLSSDEEKKKQKKLQEELRLNAEKEINEINKKEKDLEETRKKSSDKNEEEKIRKDLKSLCKRRGKLNESLNKSRTPSISKKTLCLPFKKKQTRQPVLTPQLTFSQDEDRKAKLKLVSLARTIMPIGGVCAAIKMEKEYLLWAANCQFEIGNSEEEELKEAIESLCQLSIENQDSQKEEEAKLRLLLAAIKKDHFCQNDKLNQWNEKSKKKADSKKEFYKSTYSENLGFDGKEKWNKYSEILETVATQSSTPSKQQLVTFFECREQLLGVLSELPKEKLTSNLFKPLFNVSDLLALLNERRNQTSWWEAKAKLFREEKVNSESAFRHVGKTEMMHAEMKILEWILTEDTGSIQKDSDCEYQYSHKKLQSLIEQISKLRWEFAVTKETCFFCGLVLAACEKWIKEVVDKKKSLKEKLDKIEDFSVIKANDWSALIFGAKWISPSSHNKSLADEINDRCELLFHNLIEDVCKGDLEYWQEKAEKKEIKIENEWELKNFSLESNAAKKYFNFDFLSSGQHLSSINNLPEQGQRYWEQQQEIQQVSEQVTY